MHEELLDLTGDVHLGVSETVLLIEQRNTVQREHTYRRDAKRNFDRRHNSISRIQLTDFVLVRKRL